MLTMYDSRPHFEQANPKIAVLPIGAVEQHGSHLPVGTDTLIGSAFAERVAERLQAYLLPPVAISSSIEHRAAKGTVYLKATTLGLVVRDIAECLDEAGYEKLVLINGHGGNWILKPTIRQLNRDLDGLETILIHTSAGIDRQNDIVDYKQHDIHAGEKETSIMLHLYPGHVGTVKELTDKRFQPQDYMDYFDVMDLSDDGYWGYPEAGTAAKGEKLLDAMVDGALRDLERLDAYHAEVRSRKGGG